MIKIVKAKVKRLILKTSGKVRHLKKRIDCNKQWYGNVYGGFYVCPDFLNINSVVYSFGIGEDASFDRDIIEKHDCNVFAFDPTPKSIRWVSRQEISEKFRFFEFGISNKSGLIDFFLPKNPDHVSGSMLRQNNVNIEEKILVEMKTIEDIMNERNHTHIDVLKMDIEGEEYDVINNILDNNISVGQILVEFHDRFFEDGVEKSLQTVNTVSYTHLTLPTILRV